MLQSNFRETYPLYLRIQRMSLETPLTIDFSSGLARKMHPSPGSTSPDPNQSKINFRSSKVSLTPITSNGISWHRYPFFMLSDITVYHPGWNPWRILAQVPKAIPDTSNLKRYFSTLVTFFPVLQTLTEVLGHFSLLLTFPYNFPIFLVKCPYCESEFVYRLDYELSALVDPWTSPTVTKLNLSDLSLSDYKPRLGLIWWISE